MPFFFATTGQDIRDRLTGAADPLSRRNLSVANYAQELQDMKKATKQEFIASLKRKSSGFSREASIYRGVTRHHQQGRWQARIGRVTGNKDLYLGTFAIEEVADEAYDIAAVKFRGSDRPGPKGETGRSIAKRNVKQSLCNELFQGQLKAGVDIVVMTRKRNSLLLLTRKPIKSRSLSDFAFESTKVVISSDLEKVVLDNEKQEVRKQEQDEKAVSKEVLEDEMELKEYSDTPSFIMDMKNSNIICYYFVTNKMNVNVYMFGVLIGGVGVVCGDGVDNGVGGVVCGVVCGVVKALISMMIVSVPEKDIWCGTKGIFVWWKGVRVTKASKRANVGVRASSTSLMQRIISSLHAKFAMTHLGPLNYFLGISATHTTAGIFLSQTKYDTEILERAQMLNCNPCRTPVDTKKKLGPEGSSVTDPTLYRSLAGALQYLTFT
ncbi:ribonuclease H-like domain-containing protein [Tanacetum coccineum]